MKECIKMELLSLALSLLVFVYGTCYEWCIKMRKLTD